MVLATLTAFSFNEVKAQSLPSQVTFTGASSTVAKTTLTNTDTAIGLIRLAGNYDVVTIQAIVNKTSGTVGGTVLLQASLDGTNYDAVDSLVCSNQTVNFKHFKLGASNYYWYRLYYKTYGTQVSTLSTYYVARKQFGQ